ncbi:MAG TPA: hypothetical protein VFZ61_03840 [Polyangiales bacterium]
MGAELEALDWRVTDDAVEVHLGRVLEGAPDADHALVTLRVVTEPAPCWGHEQRVELVDVEGDPEGVEAWVEAHEGDVLEQFERTRTRGGLSWLLN